MRHRRSTRISGGVVCAALAAGAMAVAATDRGPTASARAAGDDCPERPLRLPADAVAPASRTAFDSQRGRYEQLGTRPLVARAALGEFDGARGEEARRDCGRLVARRTVVVHLESASARFRDRSPSLSQGVVFVSALQRRRLSRLASRSLAAGAAAPTSLAPSLIRLRTFAHDRFQPDVTLETIEPYLSEEVANVNNARADELGVLGLIPVVVTDRGVRSRCAADRRLPATCDELVSNGVDSARPIGRCPGLLGRAKAGTARPLRTAS